MSKEIVIPQEIISSKIYEIRGKKVMLDRDLATLYDVKAIRLREQVKRNLEKFPEHFMFQLTENETDSMVSQNAIPSKQHLGGFLPYVFTEHGVLQLANVLSGVRATQMSIKIIEVFVKMREMFLTHKDILVELEVIKLKLGSTSNDIELIFEYLKQFEQAKQQELEQQQRIKIGYKKEK
ncbi:MAG: DNA-binding protein [Bacteroidetes bacterium RIFCSPLOWO2_12_FULL_31_6]|nr:MAG: DNA-binding protein [Bacteroidetes bacterium RIFCSPLOWO2_12_FULL_31_6]